VASVLVGAGVNGALGRDVIVYLVVGVGLALALTFAVFGYGLIVILQLVSSIASAILIVGIIALTWQHVDIGVALTHPDGPWMLAGTAAVLVFSFIGLLWANSSGDLARYQRPGSSSPGSMLSTAFGATIPTFVLISYGALLAASDETIAAGLVSDPFDTIGQLLPLWYPAPLITAIVLGLLSAVVLSIYSGGFALTALGVRLTRVRSALVIGALVALGTVAFILLAVDYTMLFRDLATTLAVPVAAWAGIFAADTMIRQRPYDSEALLARGGIYPAFNWVNLSALVVIIAVGFGLTTASVAGLTWQGYLFPLLGLPIDGAAAGTDLGVIVALVLGLLVPITAGIPGIRKQEATARRSG
jgi:purine-cytosine permease-like protein